MGPTHWYIPSIFLCIFGFFKESLPSEPFLTPYLVQYKNISEEAVTNQIYPIWTYSYMAALIPVFLFTDFLRYKPIIILEGCAFIATYALLLWSYSIPLMQLMQMFYGLATASEIAYYSYIYAAVSSDRYKQVSSYTRSAVLMGNFIAGALGQLLYSLNKTDKMLYTLHILSMTSIAIATTVSLFLPSVRKSKYFHREEIPLQAVDGIEEEDQTAKNVNGISQYTENEESTHRSQTMDSQDKESNAKSTEQVASKATSTSDITLHNNESKIVGEQKGLAKNISTWRHNLHLLIFEFRASYSNKQLVKWSLWWAFATCGAHQVSNYIQTLWQVFFSESEETQVSIYNGAVHAVSTLVSALASFSIVFIKLNWSVFGEIVIGLVSIIDSLLLVTMVLADNIWVCYIFFIIFHALYQLVKTIATYQIAKHLTAQRYGLVFGCNTFMAAVLQSILTLIVVDYRTLNASPQLQFLIYGGCFFVLGMLFCCKAVYVTTNNGWRWSWKNRYEMKPRNDDDEAGEEMKEEDCGELASSW